MDLRVEANADNLRALLDWMKLDTHAVPADRLRRASLAARLVGTPGRFEIGGLDLRVDTSRLSGAVAYVDRGRPAFGARLELDRLNLDAYLPPETGAAPTPAAQPAPSGQPQRPAQKAGRAAARQPEEPASLRLLKSVDANLDLTVSQLTVRGLPVQGIRLDATVAGGGVTIREARIDDFIGLKGRLDGQVAAVWPLRGANLALTAEAANLSSLPSAVAWPPGIPAPERLGAVTARARVAGDAERLAVEVNAGIADATLEAGGALLALETDPAADLKLRLTHPEIGRAAALFGDGQPARAYGPLDLYAELRGPRKMPVLGNIQGIVAGVPLRGRANANLTGSRPRVEADLQTGDLDIARLAAAPALASRVGAAGPAAGQGAGQGSAPAAAPAADTPARFDLGWMRSFDGRLALTPASLVIGDTRIDEPALRATLENGVLKLEEFDGSWAGGQVWASGKLVAAEGAAPAMDGTVTVGKARLDQLAGLSGLGFAGGSADLEATLATTGDSGDALLRGLTGKGRVAARDGLLTGLDFAAIRDRLTRIDRPQEVLGAIAGGLQGGQTRFGRLDGTFTVRNGVARTEDTRAVTDFGEAAVVGQVSLPQGTVDARMRVTIAADPPLPPLSLRVSGPLAAPTRSLEMQELQDYFARRAGEALKPSLPVPNLQGVPANPEGLIRGLIDGLKR
ncbi:AsmA family protein [Azospirillum thermophilum]|uniref:AsmA family protein n=1 Tax=Azospirillum thermophilum TaxID=2202148 RepID=UPI001FECE518|nr:AsmA-like C-terminal region-containing protein [Azospirillum thermophilum]